MRTYLRGKITLLFMMLGMLLAIPAIAFADDISNNLDGSIDADVETTSVNTGSTTDVGYLVQPRNSDGQNGCNIQGGESLKVNVASSNTAVATVSPSSLTFTACGDTPSVTVNGVSAGTADITLSQSSNNTGGSFNFATAKFSVTVSDPTPPADTTAPTIDYTLTPGIPDGNNGWYKSDVTLVWNVSDPESAVTKTGCVDQNITSDQAATTYSCSASSEGGNAGPVNVTIKRDATDPNVALNGGPADGQSYFFGDTPAAPTCDASDALSELDGACSVSGYSSAVGTHTVTATATDMAGNENTASSTYTVKPYTLNGFYQPIDMNDTVNTVKNGSTVPVKFELFKGATELTSTSAVTSIKSTPISCASLSGDPEDAIETVATGGTSLRYDATAGQFIYNWTTPKGATQVGKCYSLTMTAADSSTIIAYFKLK
jgi:hypothetical protein